MPDSDERMEAMLFDYATTYRTAYKNINFTTCSPTIYKKKDTCLMIRPPPLRDIHTLTDWKAAAIPFDLLLQRKDIVGIDPRSIQKRYEKPIDTGREEAQSTRPRLVMTPAVSMDDVADGNARAVLCEDMYTTYSMRSSREGAPDCSNVTAPLPALPAPSNPIVLPKLQLPFVSPEWRMETVAWDGKQLRTYCDHTKEFWLKHELNKCRACDETKAVKAHRNMQDQLKSGRR